jgi:hypothetical protein
MEPKTDKKSAVKSQEQEPQDDEGELHDDSEDTENQPSHVPLQPRKPKKIFRTKR